MVSQFRMKALVALASIAALLLGATTAPGTATADTAIVVAPWQMNGWGFVTESAVGSGSLESGPAPAPLGTGSARFQVTNGGQYLGVAAYAGLPLADIQALSYATYRSSFDAGNLLAVSLQINVDYDGAGGNEGWQGRLVFEPYHGFGPTVNQNMWQSWDTLTGKWWGSNAAAAPCLQATPCTWPEVLSAFPNARVHATLGAIGFKAGSGWASFDGNADALAIMVGGDTTTYDFEPNPECAFSTTGTTMTLEGDCITDGTIAIPDGYTLDGDGHTITAVDPAGDHFRGGIVENAGATAHVTNLTVTSSNLANICDEGAARLRGILFDGASGSITNTTVVDVNQGPSGCQEGNAIEVRNEPFDSPGTDVSVLISGNQVSGYIKNGITANGSVAATITNNAVIGGGPLGVPLAAQNGIQVGFGATAEVRDNTVSGHNYTPESYQACGVLLYEADGVKLSRTFYSGNERDLCNFGRGGGKFKPVD